MTAPTPQGGPLPAYVTLDEPPAAKGRPRRTVRAADRTLAIMLAWMVVVAGGVIGIATLAGGGGAGGPSGAVDALFAAASEEDVIGVLEAMTPVERDILIDGVTDVTAELERLGVLDDVDLSAVGGVDLEFEGLTYQEIPLTDGIVAVEVTGGTLTASAACAELPLGDAVDEMTDGDWEQDCEDSTETTTEDLAGGDSEIRLVAVEEDGGWYVSAGYSIAEAVRHDSGSPVPAFDGEIEAVGADSPEAAVEGLVAAGADLDLGGMIGMLPPDEMAPLYDYAPLFLDDAQAEIDEMGAEVSVDVDLSEVSRDGDVARVRMDGYSMSATYDEGSIEVAFDGECVTTTETTTSEGGWFMYAPNSGMTFSPDEELTEEELEEWAVTVGEGEPYEGAQTETYEDTYETCLDDLGEDDRYSSFWPLTDVGAAGTVTVVEVDGRWYVSPVRTMFDALVEILASVDDLDAWFDSFFGVSTETRFEAVGEAIPSDDEAYESYEEFEEYEEYDYEAVDEAYTAVDDCGERFYDLLYSEDATARELYDEAVAAASCGEAALASFPEDVVAEVGPIDATWFDYCFELYAGIDESTPPELRAAADRAVTRCLEESWDLDLPDVGSTDPAVPTSEPAAEEPTSVPPSTEAPVPGGSSGSTSTTAPPAGG